MTLRGPDSVVNCVVSTTSRPTVTKRRTPGHSRWHTTLAAASLLAFGALAVISPSAPAEPDTTGGQGQVTTRNYPSASGLNDYLVYTPRGWKSSDRLPLYVMVHGCGTTAEQQMGANLLNALADRERFVVAYPDNGGKCWGAVAPNIAHVTRGAGGDADIIAGMTQEIISDYGIDTDRVYMMGMSSGAFQTSATAAAYPELYAAIGVSAGGGPDMNASCATFNDAVAPLFAPGAVSRMGAQAHVMPFFSIGGTLDPLGEQSPIGGCSRLGYLSWMATNNLLRPSADGDTFRDDPTSTVSGQVPDGYSWTRHLARDRNNCQVAERWIVNGMDHYWPGGSTDPQYWADRPDGSAGYNDPKGPDASSESWRFFRQFTLTGGNTSCS
ncbi:extracellular catalytic domain type 1 short-chain-length polyhydroxyalkanoate depolymerase [Nocardia thailandica]